MIKSNKDCSRTPKAFASVPRVTNWPEVRLQPRETTHKKAWYLYAASKDGYSPTFLLTTTGSFSVVGAGCSEEDIAALGRLECDGCPFTRGVPVGWFEEAGVVVAVAGVDTGWGVLEDGELEAGGPRAQAELAMMLLFLGGLFAVEILLML
jgi:hypothetical protein